MIDVSGPILAGLTILAAGLLKGIVGIGAPLVAMPLLATIYDVPTAIAVMTVPLFGGAFWQMWSNRQARQARDMLIYLLGGCAGGVVLGTLLLGLIPNAWLAIVLAGLVFGYVGLYLKNPDIALSPQRARRAAAPVGLLTGILQGSAGVSTPVSVTFVHAQRLDRRSFLFVTQSMFIVMAVTQFAALSTAGIMTARLALASLAALAPMMAGIWLGQHVGRLASQRTFERLTLAVLTLIAVSLLTKAVPAILG
jgi:uncharacterized membrane protein YfcA